MNKVTHYGFSGREGWDLHDALADVARQLEPKSYLEVGVDGGESLRTVLKNCSPSRITLCDEWGRDYGGHGFGNHNHVQKMLESFPYDEEGLDWGYKGEVRYLDGDTRETLKTLPPDDVYDMILVDADHSAEGARADLNDVWPHLAPGGALVFDDIRHESYPWLGWVFEEFIHRSGAIRIKGAISNAGVVVKRED